jgi:hypothetical protein
VTDLVEVCWALENLGLVCQKMEKRDEVGMQIAWLKQTETTVELMEATDSSSPIFNDPPGIHHLGLKVKNLDEIYQMMKKSDRYIIDGEIRQGIHSRIFFFRITGQQEILFECTE